MGGVTDLLTHTGPLSICLLKGFVVAEGGGKSMRGDRFRIGCVGAGYLGRQIRERGVAGYDDFPREGRAKSEGKNRLNR